MTPRGIDLDALAPWFESHAPAVKLPLTASLIAGGRSNLTYRITDAAGHAFVLRRPPLGPILPSAHDVVREHRIISALAGSGVPVPPAVGVCDDEAVIGAPFYVMEFVEGTVAEDEVSAAPLSMAARHRSGISLAEVLSVLHGVDLDTTGLGNLAKRDDYVARQLKRWLDQYHRQATRDIPLIDQVHAVLAERIPPQQGATIVHGDYRLGNTIVDQSGNVVAVLDWELCTLGDPLADVGYMLMSWPETEREAQGMWSANVLPGFARRAELLDAYAAASGRDVSGIDYYVAFAYWRIACIVDGVYARTIAGQQGDKQIEVAALAARPIVLAELAAEAAARLR